MRLVVCVFFLMLGHLLVGQNYFHRGYPAANGQSLVNLGGKMMNDGSHVFMEGELDTDSTYNSINITKLSKKGDVEWTRNIAPVDPLLKFREYAYNIIVNSKDSIYFTVNFDRTEGTTKLIGALKPSGQLIFMKELNEPEGAIEPEVYSQVAKQLDDNVYHYSTLGADHLLLNLVDKNGNILTSKKYEASSEQEELIEITGTKINFESDSTTLLTSLMNVNFLSGGFTKLDKNGNVAFNKLYTTTNGLIPVVGAFKAIKTNDKGYVVSGQYIDFNPADIAGSYFGSFILKTDSIGDVVWSKVINKNAYQFNTISDHVLANNGSIMVYGNIINDNGVNQFISNIAANGTVNWTKLYQKTNSLYTFNGEIVKNKSSFVAYGTAQNSAGNLRTNILSIKNDGTLDANNCAQDFENPFIDYEFVSDTFKLRSATSTVTTTDAMVKEEGYTYNIPVLELPIEYFCKNKPISYTFMAKTDGAVSYVWTDESTLDSLHVTEVGQYAVTVTIDDEYCFMLCDTGEIKLYPDPMANISQSEGNYCSNGKVTLTASGATYNGNATYLWSTGATTKSIETDAFDTTISVIITDDCGITANASITVTKPSSNLSGSIRADIDTYCPNIIGNLTAEASSDRGIKSIIWSDGFTTATRPVTAEGVYTAKVFDNCRDSITLTYNFAKPAPKVSINLGLEITSYCPTVDAGIIATANSNHYNISQNLDQNNFTFKWSTNETTRNISIVQAENSKTYSVTITDKCGNSATRDTIVKRPDPVLSVNITPEITQNCPTVLGTLTASGSTNLHNNNELVYAWSTGESTPVIAVNQAEDTKTYTVTITDKCNNKATADHEVNIIKKTCYKFPNIFIQDNKIAIDSVEYQNTLFGAVKDFECDAIENEEITKYELYIYNRFGQQVFQSNDINKLWDGKKDGNELPEDIYVWYAKFLSNGCEIEQKGDVMLFIPKQ